MTRGIDLDRLTRVLDDSQTVERIRRYFADSPAGGRYTGRRFESLAGGGDRPETANRVTADDIVAVGMLGVTVPAEAAIQILEGRLGRELAVLLTEVPTGVALADDAAADLVADGSPADRAWWLLNRCEDVGWTIASKLLARKRPHLLPVYDRVVRCAVGRPDRYWTPLHAALRADRGALSHRLSELREAAGLDRGTSLIRTLDVALWMRHHCEHAPTGCPGLP